MDSDHQRCKLNTSVSAGNTTTEEPIACHGSKKTNCEIWCSKSCRSFDFIIFTNHKTKSVVTVKSISQCFILLIKLKFIFQRILYKQLSKYPPHLQYIHRIKNFTVQYSLNCKRHNQHRW